jgi:hypothetical protein
MEDIRQYLKQKDAIAACFQIENKTCRISIATKSQEHLKEIVNGWNEIRTEDSDLHYMFREISFLPREEQISTIQSQISHEGATTLLTSEEQEITQICRSHGASEVYYKDKGDQFRFLITGHLDEEVMEQLGQVEKSRKHIYMNPPRCRWTYSNGEIKPIGAVTPLKSEAIINSGEQLL